MSIKIDVIPEKGGFEDKMKKMVIADQEWFAAGWFEDQGNHSDTDFSYTELGIYHATGGNGTGRVIQRDILALANAVFPVEREAVVHKLLGAWIDNPTDSNFDKMLGELGEHVANRVKSLFGSNMLHPTSYNPDPLIDTGELMENTAYKTSKNPSTRVV